MYTIHLLPCHLLKGYFLHIEISCQNYIYNKYMDLLWGHSVNLRICVFRGFFCIVLAQWKLTLESQLILRLLSSCLGLPECYHMWPLCIYFWPALHGLQLLQFCCKFLKMRHKYLPTSRPFLAILCPLHFHISLGTACQSLPKSQLRFLAEIVLNS